MVISVCICTFRRPILLANLLDALVRQEFGQLNVRINVVVVDNDPDHSAKSVLLAFDAPPGFNLVFAHEPEPNIAVARNTAVRLATGDVIAFIDDDETPESDWLLRLSETQFRLNADAVFGPVIPRYHSQTPLWLREGNFFERPRFVTGTLIDERNARTGNVMVNAQRLKSLAQPFDPSFGRTGGADSLLFKDFLAMGCILAWCDEASVYEDVPLEMASVAWLLRRSFRIGQTSFRIKLYRLNVRGRLLHGCYLGVRSTLQLLVSLACALAWLPVSRTKAFRWIRTAIAQVGKLTAMARFRYNAYGN